MRFAFIFSALAALLGPRGIGALLALVAALTYDPYNEGTRFYRSGSDTAAAVQNATQTSGANSGAASHPAQGPTTTRTPSAGPQGAARPVGNAASGANERPVVDEMDQGISLITRARSTANMTSEPVVAQAPAVADPFEPSALRRDPVNATVDPMIAMKSAMARDPACRSNVLGAVPPDLTNQRFANTQILCWQGYAVQTNPYTRTPLWTAHRLTPAGVVAARNTLRSSEFFDEPRVFANSIGRMADYRRSGFDRGHMVPSGDMPSPELQNETFSMVNIIPQDPTNNRCLWSDIEMAVRMYVHDQRREVYVVTAPLHRALQPRMIGNGVVVPSHIMKAVYEPASGRSIVFFVENTADPNWTFGTIDDMRRGLGMTIFPAVNARSTILDIDPRRLRPREGCPQPRSPR